MGLFVTEVTGPSSVEDFSQGFIVQIVPSLEGRVGASAWVDDFSGYLVVGDAPQDPAGLLATAAEPLGWLARTRFLQAAGGLPFLPPQGMTVICDMPYNRHDITNRPRKKCNQGHEISDEHRVDFCPQCSLPLY